MSKGRGQRPLGLIGLCGSSRRGRKKADWGPFRPAEWGQSNRWSGAYDAHDCAKREKRLLQIARIVSLGAVFSLRPAFGLEGRVNRHGLLVYWTCVLTSAHYRVSYMITAHRRSLLLLRPTSWLACWLATFHMLQMAAYKKTKRKPAETSRLFNAVLPLLPIAYVMARCDRAAQLRTRGSAP